ncbi:MAG: phosphate/phosphite/phosphonate ABC transporter substrate-binding protein [Pseudomonadota bacterium]
MYKYFIIFFIIVVFTANSAIANDDKVFYSIGVVPQFEARKLHSIWRPILDYLEKETGYSFELRGSPSIPEFEREFQEGRFDFAYMNPYHLVMANEKMGYQPLIRDHGRKLYGVLVVKKNSNISSPTELNGEKIAFPAPNALGASLQMRQELADNFGIKITPVYVKTHDSVYLNVLLDKSTAGGGVQKTLSQQKSQFRDALKVIHTTTKVTPHPFAVLPSVPEKVKVSVTQALLKYGQTDEGRKQLAKIPIKQIGIASLEDYMSLKKLGLERFYVQP